MKCPSCGTEIEVKTKTRLVAIKTAKAASNPKKRKKEKGAK